MGKTRAECSQNAYTSAFLSHWIQILANSSPKSDIFTQKKKNLTLFFRILRSVGRGQHNNLFFWPKGDHWEYTSLTWSCTKSYPHLDNFADVSLLYLLIAHAAPDHHPNLDVVPDVHGEVIVAQEVGPLPEDCCLRWKQLEELREELME